MAAIGKQILVAYDGSAASTRALARAAELAGYGSRVAVVSAAPAPAGENGRSEARKLLEDARSELARWHVRAELVDAAGTAVDALVEAALHLRADLLVVGDGNGGDPSASLCLVREAPCDVLVVR